MKFPFVSAKRYRRLKDEYEKLKDYYSTKTTSQLYDLDYCVSLMTERNEAISEATKYKELYLDELQKRIDLSEKVRKLELN